MDVSKLEPADRNFKREVTTLLVILLIALVAGGVILYKYVAKTNLQKLEQSQGRAPEVGELTKNYSFINLEGGKTSFFDYTGHATLVACFSAAQLEDSELVVEVLKGFEERYKNNDRIKILMVSMDAEDQVDLEKVKALVEAKGMVGSKWSYAFANGDKFLAYIKKELKFIHLAKAKKEGRWIVPQRIRILAPDLKLRGLESEYDFGKMKRDEEIARIEAPKKPNFKTDKVVQGDVNNIKIVQWGQDTMFKNIDYMLENEPFDKVSIDANKKKNIYEPFLYLFAGFILFLIVLGLKVKRGSSKTN